MKPKTLTKMCLLQKFEESLALERGKIIQKHFDDLSEELLTMF
jgi:hypothetical protein